MTPLESDSNFNALLSVAVPILITGLIALVNKLWDIRQKRREAKENKPVQDATVKKTEAEGVSVEADVFQKALQGQGSVVDQLLRENARAYTRAQEAEDSAAAANTTAQAAKDEATAAREEVAALRKEMEANQREHVEFEKLIEGYLIQHKVGLPPWWPHHNPDGSAPAS